MNAQGSGQGAVLDANYRLVDKFESGGTGRYGLADLLYGPRAGVEPAAERVPASTLAETSTTPPVTVGGVAAKVLFSGLAPVQPR